MYDKIDLLPEGQVSEEYYEKAKDTIQKLNEAIKIVCDKWELFTPYFYDVRLYLTENDDDWFVLEYEKRFNEDASIALVIQFQDGKTSIISFSCYDDNAGIYHHEVCPVDSWFFDQFLTCSLIVMDDLYNKYLG